MAAPAAKRLTVRNEEPLNQTEISMATGLLHRAVLNGQQSLLINQFRQSRASKMTHVPFEQLIDECDVINDQMNAGGMSDAAKRQREFTEDETGEWDRISMVESQASSYVPYAAAGKGSAPSAPFHESQQEPVKSSIKVPDGMTVTQWGMSLCKMDKVKEWNRNGMAYCRLVECADNRPEVCRYLSWIKSTFGTGGTGMPKKKITPAVDLAYYLEYIKWEPAGTDQVPFVREFAQF